FFQAEDGIRDFHVTGVQTCALPISPGPEAAVLETRGRFRVVTVVAGAAVLRDAQGMATPASRGDTLLVPACHAEVTLEASPDAELLVSFVPDLARDVRAPLRAAGHSDAAIAALAGPSGVTD